MQGRPHSRRAGGGSLETQAAHGVLATDQQAERREQQRAGKGGTGAHGKGQPAADALPQAAADALQQLAQLGEAPSAAAAAQQLRRLATALRGAPPAQLKAVRRHAAPAGVLAALAASPPPPGEAAHLAALLSSCAMLQLKAPRPVLDALGDCLAEAVPAMQPAPAAQAAWALSRLGFCTPTLLRAVEEAALAGSWLQDLDADTLASLLWVCNRASHASQLLLAAATEALCAPRSGRAWGGSRSSSGGGEGGGGSNGAPFSRTARGGRTLGPAALLAATKGSGGGSSSSAAGGHLTPRQVSIALHSCGALQFKPSEVRCCTPPACAAPLVACAHPRALRQCVLRFVGMQLNCLHPACHSHPLTCAPSHVLSPTPSLSHPAGGAVGAVCPGGPRAA